MCVSILWWDARKDYISVMEGKLMFKSVRQVGVCTVMVLAFLATAQAAVMIDFNSGHGYSDGNLGGQTDTGVGATWSNGSGATAAIFVENAATDGRAGGTFGSPGTIHDVLTLPTAEVPNIFTGKIQIDLDFIGPANPGGNAYKLEFKDSAGNEKIRLQVSGGGTFARLNGGAVGSATLTVGIGVTRHMVMVIDTTTPSPGGTVTFFADSLAGTNLGSQAYTTPLDNISMIDFESFNVSADGLRVDNINITPEPTSLALLGLASICLGSRRRRLA
jgi:hypothetical protein